MDDLTPNRSSYVLEDSSGEEKEEDHREGF